MQRTIVCVCVCVCVALPAAGELRCEEPMERCHRVGGKDRGTTEDQFKVEDHSIIFTHEYGKHLRLDCGEWEALDSPALPSFTSALLVSSVTLDNCPPPAAGSLLDSLGQLNVTLLRSSTQGSLALRNLPSGPPLTAAHFAGLEDLVELELEGTNACFPDHISACPSPVAGFLGSQRQRSVDVLNSALVGAAVQSLDKLRSLVISRVRLSPSELDNLPASLHTLKLQTTGVEHLPTHVFQLPHLYNLQVIEKKLTVAAVPPTLRALRVESDNTGFILGSIGALEEVTLVNWSERRPKVLTQCDALTGLSLLSPSVEALPERWLARCSRLERLDIDNFSLSSLPPQLLEDASALVRLSLTRGLLETLPLGLLDDLSNLRTLDVTGNKIKTLPSNLFASPRRLDTLRLSKNLITAGEVQALAELTSLKTLKLDHNPRLGDLCGIAGYSPLVNLTKLVSLSLEETNITLICRDWRENLTSLATVNLKGTAIPALGHSDLRYIRDESVTGSYVLLDGAPVSSVRLTEHEYNNAQSLAESRATVQLDTGLKCDCDMYWTRMALDAKDRSPRVTGLRCSDGRALRHVPLDEMVCRNDSKCHEAQAPAACSCTERPEAGGRTLVRVDCKGAGLHTVPTLRAIPSVIYDLLLSNNSISHVSTADLPSSWRVLDIRNNLLERVANDTAWELVRSPHRLLFAGNKIACDCSAAPFLLALHSNVKDASNLSNVSCAGGGGPLLEARTVPCAAVPLVAWLTGVLAAVLLTAAAIVSYFTPPKRRVLFELILHKLGLLPLPPDPPTPQGGFRFDAFICFPPEDEDIVVSLIQELKGGSTPYHLCLEGDWMAGTLITDQIKESMRVSRRTVVLVSQDYFRCDWTQATFRAAYALALCEVTPRLVLLFLEDPNQLPLDEDMQHYICNNTYVRWGESWFWKQLRRALGTPLTLPAPKVSPASLTDSFAVSPASITDNHVAQSLTDQSLPKDRLSTVFSSPDSVPMTIVAEQARYTTTRKLTVYPFSSPEPQSSPCGAMSVAI